MDDPDGQSDICRVCRCESTPDKPLFHPCVCTGSIKFIHQECLVQWLKYSRKEYCELCTHRFSFTPIYSPDMPKRLPIKDIISGLVTSIGRAVRYWFHYTLVAFAWLGVVPLTACRIYRCLFTGSVSSLLTLPLDMLSTDNLLADSFEGFFVMTCTVCAFISVVWLREQILHGGGPEWLENDNGAGNNHRNFLDGPMMNNLVAGLGGAARAADNQNEANPAAAADAAGDGNEAPAANENNVAQDDNNWNPIEWDRAVEELTWERLLGLDGSLVFLEHVFWVVSLSTLFILVFAYCPYHIGHFTLIGFSAGDLVLESHFEGILTALIGYIIIAISLVTLCVLCSLVNLKNFQRVLGLCYIVVKVKLLVVVEIGIFPLVCGWWLDICSLSMFDATLKDRKTSYHLAPGTSMFVHWLVGMIYVFYFASFILLLREVLRPGVLWFLRNLNDPEFNPIQEMIHLPVYRHVRRFIASVIIFGSTVLLMLWLPVRVIKWLIPTFLPYNVMVSSDAPVTELSLELLLLQVVLPALLEQGHTRMWLKGLVRGWTMMIAWLLDLRSYLIGDVSLNNSDNIVHGDPADGPLPPPAIPLHPPAPPAADGNNAAPLPPPPPPVQEPPAGLAAAHQALLQGGGPTGFQAYRRPSFFHLRVITLIFLMCVTLFTASLLSYLAPVFLGRKLMSLWMGEAKIHELFTAACGLYICWLCLRVGIILYNWIPRGTAVIYNKAKEWMLLAFKIFMIGSLLIGAVPLLLGLLFELVIAAPIRVPLNQTPVFLLWQDWALGVLLVKIVCASTLMGPQWWLKRVIEQVYNDGIRNINLQFVLTKLCAPVVGVLGMALAVPYVVAKSLVPAWGFTYDTENLIVRRIYPFLLTTSCLLFLGIFQTRQFKRLYEHIKNDKYLVGQRLVNYEPRIFRSAEMQAT